MKKALKYSQVDGYMSPSTPTDILEPVLVNNKGEFVTILKQGVKNERIKNARK